MTRLTFVLLTGAIAFAVSGRAEMIQDPEHCSVRVSFGPSETETVDSCSNATGSVFVSGHFRSLDDAVMTIDAESLSNYVVGEAEFSVPLALRIPPPWDPYWPAGWYIRFNAVLSGSCRGDTELFLDARTLGGARREVCSNAETTPFHFVQPFAILMYKSGIPVELNLYAFAVAISPGSKLDLTVEVKDFDNWHVVVIPEPSTIALAFSGLFLLAACHRRRLARRTRRVMAH